MKQNFKNINEELERIKTLMFETDNFIKNGTPLNETVEESNNTSMDEKVLGKTGVKVIQKGKLSSYLKGGGGNPVYKIIFSDNAQRYLEVDPTDKTSFVLNPEGFKQAKDNGLPVQDGDKLRLVGRKDKQQKDSVLVTVIKPEDVGTVTGDKLVKAEPSKSDQITPPSGGGQDAPPSDAGQNATSQSFVEDKSLIGKKIEDLAKQFNLKITDITEKFKEAGYTASPFYKKNEDTKTVYGVDKDGNIKSIFKRFKGEKVEAVAESFNMDIIFTNPLYPLPSQEEK